MSNIDFHAIKEIIGEQLASQVQKEFGGCRFYIPREFPDKASRNGSIFRDYANGSGLTANELARKYGLTEPHIRSIIRSMNVSYSTQGINLYKD
jgi:Mor family transcriptional regulator